VIRETRDRGEVAAVARHFPEFFSDADEAREDCRYFLAERDGEPVGLIFFDHIQDDVWRGHFMMLSSGRGKGAIYARQAIKAMLSSGAGRIIGMTPIDNYRALRGAFAAGMRYAARTEKHHITECP
jgi:hypothetical protein